ncbi:MAG: mechanosensitive ion channel family protein [Vicinamibacterales bacterium]
MPARPPTIASASTAPHVTSLCTERIRGLLGTCRERAESSTGPENGEFRGLYGRRGGTRGPAHGPTDAPRLARAARAGQDRFFPGACRTAAEGVARMNWSFDQMPEWGYPLLRTLITVGGGYLLGHLVNALFVKRLLKIASRTSNHWDDILVSELKKRIPFWILLGGVWFSLAYWVFDPDIETFVKRAVIVLLGVSVSLAAASTVSRMIVQYQAEVAPEVPVTGLTLNLARLFVLGIGLLVVANTVGFQITPILTALGVGGLAVALALQEPLSNLFAGLFISLAGQIRVGDYIKLQSGEEGYVIDLDWRATRVRMLANNVIIVPNSKLSQAIVTNYGLPENEMSVLVQVGVEHASDLEKVERVTVEVARRHADRGGRREDARALHPVSHVQQLQHRLLGDPPRPGVHEPVPAEARVHQAPEGPLRPGRHLHPVPDPHAVGARPDSGRRAGRRNRPGRRERRRERRPGGRGGRRLRNLALRSSNFESSWPASPATFWKIVAEGDHDGATFELPGSKCGAISGLRT